MCAAIRCLLFALCLTAPLGCASGSFRGGVYRDGQFAFRVGPVPAAWRRIEAEGSLLAFRDDAAQATIAVNGRCGRDAEDVPLRALTQHLFIHFTERHHESQTRFALDGREALRTELQAKLDGVPHHFITVVLKKDGCVYDFIHIATRPDTSAAREEFGRFVAAFQTEQPQ